MTQQEIIQVLKTNKSFFQTHYGVENIGLFGSYAKDKFNHDSDVDILIELKEQKYDFWFAVKSFLENSLQKKVDVVVKGKYLQKQFLDIINKDLIYV